MIINSLKIQNYRCFENTHVSFSVPNNTSTASGLNVFIGENGTGKTSMLEAISYLMQSRLKTRNSIGISDFNNIDKEILIEATTNDFKVANVYGKKKFDCNGLIFKAKTRNRESSSLTSQLVFDNVLVPVDGTKAKEYELRSDVTMPWGASRLPSAEIVFFDKNRTRHLTKGLFNTKLDNVIDDLNYQVLSKIQSLSDDPPEVVEKKALLKVNKTLLDKYYKGLDDKLMKLVNDDCKSFFSNEVTLDVINNLEPFLNSFFSAPTRNDIHQLPISKLGSGYETVFSIIFLYHFYKLEGTSLILLVDEPELHLHPTWQRKLIEYLMLISKDTQVFLSTHSPYIFKNCLIDGVGLKIFTKEEDENIIVEDANDSPISHFPWSPSWGEINYYAFNLPTVEFHNELYGYLQEINKKYSVSEFEIFLMSKGIKQDKTYIEERGGKKLNPVSLTLCTYVRNQIHHPENKHNRQHTPDELNGSIDQMLALL